MEDGYKIKMKNVLIINICKEDLHYYEFVKPIEDIINSINVKYFTRNYKKINKKDLEKASHIIICGTSLKDNEFIEDLDKFKWILNFDKPVLGICGGMQIIGLIFGGKLKKKTEIGFYEEKFVKKFLNLENVEKVYHLHNNYINFNYLDFEIFSGEEVSQAVKHKKKNIFGVLFHPEVRQKGLIKEFVF